VAVAVTVTVADAVTVAVTVTVTVAVTAAVADADAGVAVVERRLLVQRRLARGSRPGWRTGCDREGSNKSATGAATGPTKHDMTTGAMGTTRVALAAPIQLVTAALPPCHRQPRRRQRAFFIACLD
jgi:hypothetical protein